MRRNILKKIGLMLVFLFITFFSIKMNSLAASFKYADFNWDEFSKQHTSFWTDECVNTSDPDCYDTVLATKEKFYTALYRELAIVESTFNKIIDDNIIIATVFYGLNPDTFSDDTDVYNIDESDEKDRFIGTTEGDTNSAKAYFDREADSVKTLINAFFGFDSVCYGKLSSSPKQDSNGNSYCDDGFSLIDDSCYGKVSSYKGSFFDAIGLSFLFGSTNEDKCKEEVEKQKANYDFVESKLITSLNLEIKEEYYWDFLINSEYLDRKPQFEYMFRNISSRAGYESVEDFLDNATEDEKKEYQDSLIYYRTDIVNGIKGVLERYGKDNFSKISTAFKSTNNDK